MFYQKSDFGSLDIVIDGLFMKLLKTNNMELSNNVANSLILNYQVLQTLAELLNVSLYSMQIVITPCAVVKSR